MSNKEITGAIHSVLEEWREEAGISAKQINRGKCLPFANDVLSESGSEIWMKRTGDEDVLGPSGNPDYDKEPYHVWVTDGYRHYDSEVPEGVSSWRELPFFEERGF